MSGPAAAGASLSRRVARAGVFLAAFIALVMVVQEGFDLRRSRAVAERDVRVHLAIETAALAQQSDAVLADAAAATTTVANVFEAGATVPGGRPAVAQMLRREVLTRRHLTDLRLYDGDGRLLARGGLRPQPEGMAPPRWILAQREGGVLHEWHVDAGMTASIPTALLASRAIHDGRGRLAGFVVAETPLSAFSDLLERQVEGTPAHALLFGADRLVIASNRAVLPGAATNVIGRHVETVAGFEALPLSGLSASGLREGQDDRSWSAGDRLADSPFHVALAIDRAGALAEWRGERLQRGLLVAGAVAATLLLVLAWARADRADRRSAERMAVLASAVEQSTSAIVVTDRDATIEYANPSAARSSGFAVAEVLGGNPRMFASGNTPRATYDEMWARLVSGRPWEGLLHNRRKDGSPFCERVRITPVADRRGRVAHYLAIKDDVTKEQQALHELRQAATVFDNSLEAIMVTDADGVIRRVNRAFVATTGYAAAEAIGRPARSLASAEHDGAFLEDLRRALQSEGRWEGELWNVRRSGERYPVRLSACAVRDGEGRVMEYVAMFADIADRKRTEEEMRYRAYYDALTGLPNRALLLERAGQAQRLARRQGTRIGAIFLDLDGLKETNDRLGHGMGDVMLAEAGRRFVEAVRDSDTVARIGGDEFAVLVADVHSARELRELGERILARLQQDFAPGGTAVPLRASAGYALTPDHGATFEAVLSAADAAMYAAKREGGARLREAAIATAARAPDGEGAQEGGRPADDSEAAPLRVLPGGLDGRARNR